MSALFNFHSFLTVVLLVICTCTYVKMQFPYVLDRKTGFRGFFWKAARIGGLLSGYAGSLTKGNDDGVTCLLLIYNVFAKIQLLLLFIFVMFFVITEFIKKLFRVAKPVRVTALT